MTSKTDQSTVLLIASGTAMTNYAMMRLTCTCNTIRSQSGHPLHQTGTLLHCLFSGSRRITHAPHEQIALAIIDCIKGCRQHTHRLIQWKDRPSNGWATASGHTKSKVPPAQHHSQSLTAGIASLKTGEVRSTMSLIQRTPVTASSAAVGSGHHSQHGHSCCRATSKPTKAGPAWQACQTYC